MSAQTSEGEFFKDGPRAVLVLVAHLVQLHALAVELLLDHELVRGEEERVRLALERGLVRIFVDLAVLAHELDDRVEVALITLAEHRAEDGARRDVVVLTSTVRPGRNKREERRGSIPRVGGGT